VQCNNWLKFGKLWDFARQVDADFIATGHYAQVRNDQTTGEWGLFRGLDDNKDQSYVLYGIARELLSRVLLPVGTFRKPDIRKLAADAGLRVATKKDSYEICFVPDNDYAGFLKRHRPHQETSGEFVDTAGQVLGHHSGYEQFTVGQRKGLGIAFGEPRFVVRIHADSRRVVLGTQADLETQRFGADRVNWLVTNHPQEFECAVKVRYRQASVPCRVRCLDGDRIEIEPWTPIAGVAPGQAAVLYSGDQVLGGGWIQSPGD
jgi:tRNA-specific 2-thiouridylase